MMYIISQIMETSSLIATLVSYHLKTKRNIFKVMCLANVLDIIHYLFLNAYSGFGTKIIALIRNIFILKKEKYKKLDSSVFLILFLIGYIVIFILTYNNIFSILPFLAAIIYMIVVWDGNELQIKRCAYMCYYLWLIYNISIFSVAGVISIIISLISTYIAYYNEKRRALK